MTAAGVFSGILQMLASIRLTMTPSAVRDLSLICPSAGRRKVDFWRKAACQLPDTITAPHAVRRTVLFLLNQRDTVQPF